MTTRSGYYAALILLSTALMVPGQGAFEWSFDGKEGATNPVAATTFPIPSEDSGDATNNLPPGFTWSAAAVAAEPTPQPAEVKPATKSATGDKAYEELIKENLELRRKITEAVKDEESAKKESRRLTTEVKDLEGRITEFAKAISQMKQQEAEDNSNPDKTVELENKLSAAEKEKAALINRLEQVQAAQAVVQPAKTDLTSTVREGSDLYKEKEAENRLLLKKLTEIEVERKKAMEEKERVASAGQKALSKAKESEERAEQYKAQLKEAEARVALREKAVKSIVEQMPVMEKELVSLKKDVSTKDTVLSQQEKELEAVKLELQRREYRLVKAEKVAALMEQAREEVNKEDHKKMRDMYYNMAVIYMKEGKFEEAEREFLRALQIDPMDSDVHYNLGVLYDEHLDSKTRAAMHYRRYLQLKPGAADADQVKSWLYDLDMKP